MDRFIRHPTIVFGPPTSLKLKMDPNAAKTPKKKKHSAPPALSTEWWLLNITEFEATPKRPFREYRKTFCVRLPLYRAFFPVNHCSWRRLGATRSSVRPT